MATLKKILVANRGEIALRVMRTCHELGIATVAVYSDADRTAPHVLFADESVGIGAAESSSSYLSIEKIIEAAQKTGADAIHPGYGFLSENAFFSEACREKGIVFIGPSPTSIRLMGDKTAARDLMSDAGVPCPPGTKNPITSVDDALEFAVSIGFPVLIKAAAGGGGKGMRIVHQESDFVKSVKAAKSEAMSAFGDDRVFVEKYLEEPRHIEFQIMADQHGSVVHFFERECSIQRRHQKVIEEAPCSVMSAELRGAMAEAAIAAARACDYEGAGTIEFLIDRDQNFYFLEMNTRLQVEHPVTEEITGVDLVALQILVAEGKKLPMTQDQIRINGHAIECRIYAEDAEGGFLPSTGVLDVHRPPSGPGIRVDSGVEEGQDVSIYYDPMISKLTVFAPDRDRAMERMRRALKEYRISGCKTTIPFCSFTMCHPAFRSGKYDTHFVQDYYTHRVDDDAGTIREEALVSALLHRDGEAAPFLRTEARGHARLRAGNAAESSSSHGDNDPGGTSSSKHHDVQTMEKNYARTSTRNPSGGWWSQRK